MHRKNGTMLIKSTRSQSEVLIDNQNNHTRLGHFLRTLGEGTVALWWERVDARRVKSWYGGVPDLAAVQDALADLQNIRSWATQ